LLKEPFRVKMPHPLLDLGESESQSGRNHRQVFMSRPVSLPFPLLLLVVVDGKKKRIQDTPTVRLRFLFSKERMGLDR